MSDKPKSEKKEPEFKFREYRNPHATEADSLGMGQPEAKDLCPSPTPEEIEARKAADPDYTPNHDGRLWLIV